MQPTLNQDFHVAPGRPAPNPLPGVLADARITLAESEEMMRGLGLADPNCPAIIGRMQAAISSMLWQLGVEVAA